MEHSLSEINKYHILDDIIVKPKQLLLDPQNPRLISDLKDDKKYSQTELASENIQKSILDKIKKSEYRVSELIKDIKISGFIAGTSPIIVKRLYKSNKFLVLEGNRRTAAIKHLLESPDSLSSSCLKTLSELNVKEFKYLENNYFSEDEIIDVILGKIHISGAVSWGAMEKAHYIYKTYMRELGKLNANTNFVEDEKTINRVSVYYNFEPAEIRNNITIYRVYEQIKSKGYNIESTRYTLIELAVKDTALRNSYFGLNDKCQFSDLGVDRFCNLIIDDPIIITNPHTFKQFSYIFKNGENTDLIDVENRTARIDETYHEIKKRNVKDISSKLENIIVSLEKLNLGEFQGTSNESELIRRIITIVDKKLALLVSDNGGSGDSYSNNDEISVANIEEVNELDSHTLQEIIKRTMRDRPNRTCIKDKVARYVLRYLKVTTRGKPRENFKRKMKKEIEDMIDSGLLKEYETNSNIRVKLLSF